MKKILKDKSIVEILSMIIIGIILILSLTACAFETDAGVASYNVSKEADMFRIKRRITFINLRSDEYLFSLVGNCSITTDNNDKQLEVTCKVGDDKYQKHFLRMSEETTYVVEQLDYSEVSKYDYEIVFKPKSIVPYKIEVD